MLKRVVGAKQEQDDRTEPGFVEAMFARTRGEAEDGVDLLGAFGIPARLEDSAVFGGKQGIAVLVPADRLIEASDLLTAHARRDDDEELDDLDEEEDEDFDDEDEEEDEDEDDDFDDDLDEDEDFDEDEEDDEDLDDTDDF